MSFKKLIHDPEALLEMHLRLILRIELALLLVRQLGLTESS